MGGLCEAEIAGRGSNEQGFARGQPGRLSPHEQMDAEKDARATELRFVMSRIDEEA